MIGGDRRTARPTVDRAADQLLGARLDPGFAQHVGQHHALPDAVADEVAADLVGDARQRDVPLDLFPGEQVVERQLELVIDHATDLEAPRVLGDLGDDDRRVDAVELVDGRDERADPVDPEVELAGGRALRTGRRR